MPTPFGRVMVLTLGPPLDGTVALRILERCLRNLDRLMGSCDEAPCLAWRPTASSLKGRRIWWVDVTT